MTLFGAVFRTDLAYFARNNQIVFVVISEVHWSVLCTLLLLNCISDLDMRKAVKL